MAIEAMDAVGLIISAAATVIFYGMNHGYRKALDVAIPLKVPERRWGYTVTELVDFRNIALEKTI